MYSDEFEKWWAEANTIRGNLGTIEAAKRLAWEAWQAARAEQLPYRQKRNTYTTPTHPVSKYEESLELW